MSKVSKLLKPTGRQKAWRCWKLFTSRCRRFAMGGDWSSQVNMYWLFLMFLRFVLIFFFFLTLEKTCAWLLLVVWFFWLALLCRMKFQSAPPVVIDQTKPTGYIRAFWKPYIAGFTFWPKVSGFSLLSQWLKKSSCIHKTEYKPDLCVLHMTFKHWPQGRYFRSDPNVNGALFGIRISIR